jgi:hypothetical protein
MSRLMWLAACGLMTLAATGCEDSQSSTELVPEGPPMIRQVFMTERYVNASGDPAQRTQVLAYGFHPDVDEDHLGPITAAVARGQVIRVVVDELLKGNHLEEIACREPVDEDEYFRVPDGADPDDIARCASGADVLAELCPASDPHSVCINQAGVPVGVFDDRGITDTIPDGAADDTRMIAGSVGIRCDGAEVELDLDASFWQPSGNQQVPAGGGFNAVGPAVILRTRGSLPTGKNCSIWFADDVTDKTGNRVCAPSLVAGDATQDGSVWPPPQGCTDGSTAGLTFSVEPLALTGTFPSDGLMTFNPTMNLSIQANADLDLASANGITLVPMAGGAPLPFVASFVNNDPSQIALDPMANLAAGTAYTLTIPTTLTDAYGGALPTAVVINFRTN